MVRELGRAGYRHARVHIPDVDEMIIATLPAAQDRSEDQGVSTSTTTGTPLVMTS